MALNAVQPLKTVGDPIAEYESMLPIWTRNRAVCGGERKAKAHDSVIDTLNFNNLLIPFSPSMSQQQYDFYRAEAELPSITSTFSKMLVGSLLRKSPVLKLPDGLESAVDWILNEFGQDGSSLAAFLDEALLEEIQTGRAWIYVDHPPVNDEEDSTAKPYPVLWHAETVINWSTTVSPEGTLKLSRVITRTYEDYYKEDEFHPTIREVVRVHELDQQSLYQVRIFKSDDKTSVATVAGERTRIKDKRTFTLTDTLTNFKVKGQRLNIIPAWPLSGHIGVREPMISPFVDKEISLYNKMSRRNHLLYGAATYTPVLVTDMGDEEFEETVSRGLGTWIRLRVGESASVLQTPTDALQYMETTIAAAIEEMAKLGIRMMTPETDQSGVALDIRNASQSAQLGTLNTKTTSTIRQVIAFMLFWATGVVVPITEVGLELSSDFSPTPKGEGWLRLATEWYQAGLIPRSVWIQLLKQNDIIPPEYDDEVGQQEITEDMDLQAGVPPETV